VLAVCWLGACTTGGDETTAEQAGGDGAAFCRLLDDAAPTADPFESGIGPDEVERRLDALRARFDALAAVAPDSLAGDLDELGDALTELDEVLAAAGYDLVALAETNPDLSQFDDPRFEEIGTRLADHRADVCDR
jgi:hypothetical protein